MSLKANTYTQTICNPMNTYRFQISIPGVPDNVALCVESTTYPSEGKTREVDLYFQGEKIAYPTLPENGGSWTFKIPDGDSGVIAQAFQALFGERYDQKSGEFFPHKWKDIDIFAQDQGGNTVFHCILHGAWIQSRSNTTLDCTNPANAWKWDYAWIYNWVEEVQLGGAGSEPPLS